MTFDDALAALATLGTTITTVLSNSMTLKQQVATLTTQVATLTAQIAVLQANQFDQAKVDLIVTQLQALNTKLAAI